jgi:hypothetical protein
VVGTYQSTVMSTTYSQLDAAQEYDFQSEFCDVVTFFSGSGGTPRETPREAEDVEEDLTSDLGGSEYDDEPNQPHGTAGCVRATKSDNKAGEPQPRQQINGDGSVLTESSSTGNGSVPFRSHEEEVMALTNFSILRQNFADAKAYVDNRAVVLALLRDKLSEEDRKVISDPGVMYSKDKARAVNIYNDILRKFNTVGSIAFGESFDAYKIPTIPLMQDAANSQISSDVDTETAKKANEAKATPSEAVPEISSTSSAATPSLWAQAIAALNSKDDSTRAIQTSQSMTVDVGMCPWLPSDVSLGTVRELQSSKSAGTTFKDLQQPLNIFSSASGNIGLQRQSARNSVVGHVGRPSSTYNSRSRDGVASVKDVKVYEALWDSTDITSLAKAYPAPSQFLANEKQIMAGLVRRLPPEQRGLFQSIAAESIQQAKVGVGPAAVQDKVQAGKLVFRKLRMQFKLLGEVLYGDEFKRYVEYSGSDDSLGKRKIGNVDGISDSHDSRSTERVVRLASPMSTAPPQHVSMTAAAAVAEPTNNATRGGSPNINMAPGFAANNSGLPPQASPADMLLRSNVRDLLSWQPGPFMAGISHIIQLHAQHHKISVHEAMTGLMSAVFTSVRPYPQQYAVNTPSNFYQSPNPLPQQAPANNFYPQYQPAQQVLPNNQQQYIQSQQQQPSTLGQPQLMDPNRINLYGPQQQQVYPNNFNRQAQQLQDLNPNAFRQQSR